MYSASSGNGGAVHHHVKGTMHFMEKLTMIDNDAYVYVSVRDDRPVTRISCPLLA